MYGGNDVSTLLLNEFGCGGGGVGVGGQYVASLNGDDGVGGCGDGYADAALGKKGDCEAGGVRHRTMKLG